MHAYLRQHIIWMCIALILQLPACHATLLLSQAVHCAIRPCCSSTNLVAILVGRQVVTLLVLVNGRALAAGGDSIWQALYAEAFYVHAAICGQVGKAESSVSRQIRVAVHALLSAGPRPPVPLGFQPADTLKTVQAWEERDGSPS